MCLAISQSVFPYRRFQAGFCSGMFFAVVSQRFSNHDETNTGEPGMTALAIPSYQDRILHQLATEVRIRHRDCLRELQIEVVVGGVVLHGRAITFYGKQIAFHEVRHRSRLTVVANRIQVQERLVG
jgi:hypothetical protein